MTFDMRVPTGYYVDTEQEAEKWINRFLETYKENAGLGLDSETTGLNRSKDFIILWSISDGRDRICVPAKLLQFFKPILENPNISFDFTNANFDAHMFANSGIDLMKAGDWRDTAVMSWLINENNRGRHGLKECIYDYFGRITPTFEQVFGKIPKAKVNKATGEKIKVTSGELITNAMADPEKAKYATDYASLDAYNSTVLRSFFDGKLSEIQISPNRTLFNYYYEVELPFTKVLFMMERRGLTIDCGYLKTIEKPVEKRLTEIHKEITKIAGSLINLKSPAQLSNLFHNVLQKPVVKMTKGGESGIKKPSTDKDVLETWVGEGDPVATLVLEHRELATLHDTFVKGLQGHVDRQHKIHTTLNQHGTVTGRLSSTEPNLQNIPRASEDKFKVRNAFVPSENMALIVSDYEQLEMRLMAHFSQDQKMIDSILKNIDLHCLTANEIYGFPYDDVVAAKKAEKKFKGGVLGRDLTPAEIEMLLMRQASKATGFGIIYGIGGEHLARNLTKDLKRLFTPEQGNNLIYKWFSVFPGVKVFIDYTKKVLWDYGIVQTLSGRFRRFGALKGMNKRDAAQAERQGTNSIIQGSASDVAKTAMLLIEKDKELAFYNTKLLLQVHDELVLECPDVPDVIKAVKDRVKLLMEIPGKTLSVPLPVDIGHGYSWSEAK